METCTRMLLLNSSLILLVAAAAANAGLSYDGHKVVRAKVEDEAQASALHQLSEIGIYDFWTEVSKIILGMFQCYRMLYFQAVPGRSVDIRTSPEETEQLGVWLEQHGITWSVMIEDVGVLMEAEKASSGKRSDSAHSMDWTSYHALEDIYGWFDYLDQTFDFCEKEVIGQTHEGQDMIVMKVLAYKCCFLYWNLCWYILPVLESCNIL